MPLAQFETDPFPGRPRILFVGLAESTHTHSWIDLLCDQEFNVRLFAMPTPSGYPSDDWPVRTYITGPIARRFDRGNRRTLHGSLGQIPSLLKVYRLGWRTLQRIRSVEDWLVQIVNDWRPDIVHTLGLDPAGFLFCDVRSQGRFVHNPSWVLQLRGGSDLTLTQFNPVQRTRISKALKACDQLLSDNRANFRIGAELGLRQEQIAPIAPVPGTGGIDVTGLRSEWKNKPSERRSIVWPKAYQLPWADGLPVLEALRISWDRIQPCEVFLLSADKTLEMWYWSLPEEARDFCHLLPRVSRNETLRLLTMARVALMPSLIDGTPNSMFEAMACGALPIVSPLETIKPLVQDGTHVLFARNLYPDEIAQALVRAMTDDHLVDEAAEYNLQLVSTIADRNAIAPRVAAFYSGMAQGVGRD